MANQTSKSFVDNLGKIYGVYAGGFIGFVIILAILEQMGVPNKIIGYCFVFLTIGVYAYIGVISRTSEISEYYVAGRVVPPFFNGMATGADWMSAASFISMAGGLYLGGYSGLGYVLGWTGGYVLVGVLLAPYLRKFGQFTVPDFLGVRYEGNAARICGVVVLFCASFTYIVAQCFGIGIITSRFLDIPFEVAIFVGLLGILVCSMLGGMRAVTWTQVAQYIILIIAYLIPVVWISVKHTGIPLPQVVYGSVLQKVTAREKQLTNDPKELEVRAIFKGNADAAKARIDGLPKSWEDGKAAAQKKLDELKEANAPLAQIKAAQKAVNEYPKTPGDARVAWQGVVAANMARSAPPMPHGEAFYSGNPDPAKAEAERHVKRINFLALIFCLMLGTAALPHILMRYYTTPSVNQARQSVFWSLFFIFLLYFTAPALAVLVKFDIYTLIVGSKFADLPVWVMGWTKVDPNLLSIVDFNKDGIVQLAEIKIGQDIVVLATPEIAGLPYVISGLVAAGGLAAALSTADGLLLTIANALSHDLYYKMINPNASTQKRIMISKILLLFVAIAAAAVAAQKPADILFLVSAAFSFGAAAFFPALVAGVFWKRANKWGAIAGMLAGFGTCFYYMATTQPWLRGLIGFTAPVRDYIWFDIQPISAGIFGVPVGIAVLIVVSLLTPSPSKKTQEFVEHVRYPNLKGDTVDTMAR